jgi:hypothetical protein
MSHEGNDSIIDRRRDEDTDRLAVGDSVIWKGSWGNSHPTLMEVTGIQLNEANGSKTGQATDSVSWHLVEERRVIVDLKNGHWAWAFQIRKALSEELGIDEEAIRIHSTDEDVPEKTFSEKLDEIEERIDPEIRELAKLNNDELKDLLLGPDWRDR